MRKRWMPLLLALMLLLLPQVHAETYDGLTDPQPESTDGTITVSALVSACKDGSAASRTELVDVLHQYFVSELACSLKNQMLEGAKNVQEQANENYLMGLAEQKELDAADAALKKAQTDADMAALEQLKLITKIRGLTDVDIRDKGLKAEDTFLTLQPTQIVLSDLVNAAGGIASAEIEQDYIDIQFKYYRIGECAADYSTASAARDEIALALVMGKATADDFRAATVSMKQARLALFSAMSDYSRLLYAVNLKCGGVLTKQAGILESYFTSSIGV